MNKLLYLIAGLLMGSLLTGSGIWFYQHQHHQRIQNAIETTDIPFLQMMSVHHDQAIVMADLIHGKVKGVVGNLAHKIAASQRAEVGMFQGWLLERNAPLLPKKIEMNWMLPHATADDLSFISRCNASGAGMEGLATATQLSQLATSKAPEASLLFLKLMLAHHAAALPMLEYAKLNAQSPAIRQAAAAMWGAQREELIQIGQLIKAQTNSNGQATAPQ